MMLFQENTNGSFLFRFSAFIFLLLSIPASAQVGLVGRRVLIKTDVVNGFHRPFSTVEVERAMTRSFSIGLSYSFGTIPFKAQFGSYNFAAWMKDASDASWNTYLPSYSREDFGKEDYKKLSNYTINTPSFFSNPVVSGRQNIIGLTFNFYDSGVISAPYGNYLQLGFRAGRQSISGSFNVPYYEIIKFDYMTYLDYEGIKKVYFKEVNVNFASINCGLGHHIYLHPRVMLDINYGINVNYTLAPRDLSIFASLISRNNGANLFSKADDYENTTYSIRNTTNNFGLYLNAKLGVLLF